MKGMENVESDWMSCRCWFDCEISERDCGIYNQIRWQLRQAVACEGGFALLEKVNSVSCKEGESATEPHMNLVLHLPAWLWSEGEETEWPTHFKLVHLIFADHVLCWVSERERDLKPTGRLSERYTVQQQIQAHTMVLATTRL